MIGVFLVGVWSAPNALSHPTAFEIRSRWSVIEVGQLASASVASTSRVSLGPGESSGVSGRVALAEHFTAVEYAADWTQDAVEGVTHVLALRPAVKCPGTPHSSNIEKARSQYSKTWAIAAAWVDDDWWGKASHARLEARSSS